MEAIPAGKGALLNATTKRASQVIAVWLRALADSDGISKVEAALEASLAGAPGHYFLRLDQGARLATKSGAAHVSLSESGPWLTGLLTCHADGYIRDEALRKLPWEEDPRLIPFVIVRLNDWVPQVRYRAEQAATQILSRSPQLLGTRILLLQKMRFAWRRHPIIDELLAAALPHASDHVERALMSVDNEVRRDAFRYLQTAYSSEPKRILQFSMRARDPRLWAYAVAALESAAETMSVDDLRKLTRSHSPSLRREAMRLLIDRDTEFAQTALKEWLFDPNSTVRLFARYYWTGDAAKEYRDALEVRRSPAGIRGVGETGKPDDISTLAPFLQHDKPSIRTAAITSICAIDSQQALTRAMPLLADPSPRVSTTARTCLSRVAYQVDIDRLMSLFNDEAPSHTRRNIILLFLVLPKWKSLSLLLGVAAQGSPDGVLARELLSRWMERQNRSLIPPTDAEYAEAKRSLENSNWLAERTLQNLMHSLRTSRRDISES